MFFRTLDKKVEIVRWVVKGSYIVPTDEEWFRFVHSSQFLNSVSILNTTKTYFIIDDDLDDQNFLIEALTANDARAQCITAVNGPAAINHLKTIGSNLPDAIFLDQNMPGLNGRQCLIELKKMPASKDIPVIVYSTSINIHEQQQLIALGASYFLVKSFSFQQLKEELSVVTTALVKREKQ